MHIAKTRITKIIAAGALAGLLGACINSKNSGAGGTTGPAPVLNTLAVSVDGGPAAAPGQINVAYVTVKLCAAGSTSQCASIDHVKLDTGSWGLRLVGSVLAANKVALSSATDASGNTLEECVHFAGGYAWGPVASADVTLAGEVASKLPVQVLDDTSAGAQPPAASPCGTGSGGLTNSVTSLGANGILGIGVFAQDCGSACVGAATPLPVYYGCTSAGVCTAENLALSAQVTNPVALFAADNNGVIVSLPALVNSNGDTSVQGELIFGIATQADNALPATPLTVLGAAATGDFNTTFNSATIPGLIDSGTNFLSFDDPNIPTCTTAAWVGFYCPTVAPLALSAVNADAGTSGVVNTVNFAVADPNSFVATASALIDLAGGGGSTSFTWGMPFFYGQKIYIGIEQRAAGSFTGPFYAY
jgi:hypothetical protein